MASKPAPLPPIRGSYQVYCDNTTKFTSWLRWTATECGYRFQEPYTVKKILQLAEYIAKKGAHRVFYPNIRRAAQRAIKLRKDTSNYKQSKGDDPDSDRTHLFFIETMQKSLDTLQELRSRKPVVHNDTAKPLDLENQFNQLKTEERQDDTHDEGHSAFEEEEEEDEEFSFANALPALELQEWEDKSIQRKHQKTTQSQFFFMDMQTMRQFLTTIWTDYKDDKIDLATAAMVTNAAISLVQQMARDIALDLSETSGSEMLTNAEPSYVLFASCLLPESWCGMQKAAPVVEPALLTTEEGHLVHLGLFQTLSSYVRSRNASRKQRGKQSTDDLFGAAQCSDIEKSGPSLTRSTEPKKLIDEHHVVLKYLRDLTQHNQNLEIKMEKLGDTRPRHVDELSKALMGVAQGNIQMHAVFAARILLDITQLLGDDHKKSIVALRKAADRSAVRMEFTSGSVEPGYNRLWPKETYNGRTMTQKLAMIIDEADQATTAVFHTNQTYCGTVLTGVTLLTEAMGIELATQQAGVVICSYLYSALKEKSLLDQTWPDLESAMKLHSDNIFPHAKPSSISDYVKLFRWRNGCKIQPEEMKGSREGSVSKPTIVTAAIPSRMEAKGRLRLNCLQLPETSRYLSDHFNGETMVRTAYAIDQGLEKEAPDESAYATLPAVALLTRLRDNLPEILETAKLDYINLTWDCNDVLRSIMNSGKIGNKHPLFLYTNADIAPAWDDKEVHMHQACYVNLVSHILVEGRQDEANKLPSTDKTAYKDLRTAATFIRSYLANR